MYWVSRVSGGLVQGPESHINSQHKPTDRNMPSGFTSPAEGSHYNTLHASSRTTSLQLVSLPERLAALCSATRPLMFCSGVIYCLFNKCVFKLTGRSALCFINNMHHSHFSSFIRKIAGIIIIFLFNSAQRQKAFAPNVIKNLCSSFLLT